MTPTIRIAIIRRLVATGRSMKMREGFTPLRPGASASLRRACARGSVRRRARRRRRGGRRRPARSGRTFARAGLVAAALMMLALAVGRAGRRSAGALLLPLTGRALRRGRRGVVHDLHLDAVAQMVDAV